MKFIIRELIQVLFYERCSASFRVLQNILQGSSCNSIQLQDIRITSGYFKMYLKILQGYLGYSK